MIRLPDAHDRELDDDFDSIDSRSPWSILIAVAAILGLLAFLAWANQAFGASPSVIELQSATCDILEISHYYDDDGHEVLCQLVAWSWCKTTERHQIRSWKIVKGIRDHPRPVSSGWEANWSATQVARAPHFKESWWTFDIELIERKNLPPDERIPLFADRWK